MIITQPPALTNLPQLSADDEKTIRRRLEELNATHRALSLVFDSFGQSIEHRIEGRPPKLFGQDLKPFLGDVARERRQIEKVLEMLEERRAWFARNAPLRERHHVLSPTMAALDDVMVIAPGGTSAARPLFKTVGADGVPVVYYSRSVVGFAPAADWARIKPAYDDAREKATKTYGANVDRDFGFALVGAERWDLHAICLRRCGQSVVGLGDDPGFTYREFLRHHVRDDQALVAFARARGELPRLLSGLELNNTAQWMRLRGYAAEWDRFDAASAKSEEAAA